MSRKPKTDQPHRRSGWGIPSAFAVAVIGLWAGCGLWPALWALRKTYQNFTRDGQLFDWNARLGTFGDSFAGVGSLIASLGLLAIAYQLLRDREQRAADELAQENQKEHQAKLAMLAVLMQARIALGVDVREKMRKTADHLSEANLSTRAKAQHEKNRDYLIRSNNINSNELNRMMKFAESMINWTHVEYDSEGEPVKESNEA